MNNDALFDAAFNVGMLFYVLCVVPWVLRAVSRCCAVPKVTAFKSRACDCAAKRRMRFELL